MPASPLKMDDTVFKLIGLAPRSLESHLRETALSLRRLTSDERKGVNVKVVRVANAKEGESLKELSRREKNILDLSLTALINGLDEDAQLEQHQAIKIIALEKY